MIYNNTVLVNRTPEPGQCACKSVKKEAEMQVTPERAHNLMCHAQSALQSIPIKYMKKVLPWQAQAPIVYRLTACGCATLFVSSPSLFLLVAWFMAICCELACFEISCSGKALGALMGPFIKLPRPRGGSFLSRLTEAAALGRLRIAGGPARRTLLHRGSLQPLQHLSHVQVSLLIVCLTGTSKQCTVACLFFSEHL